MKEEEERIPLRTILQNFLNHIEKLDNEKLEGSYDKEFQELKLFSELLKTSKQYSCSQGEKEVNRKKNRYKDILPFDCSRVILEDYAGIPGSDYINANYIKGASGSPAYIASQGPLPHTVNDFWRMVVQCEVQVIVMACNEEESGKHKCENYWVEHEGEEKQFGMVAIQLIKASVVCPDFLVRTMRLKYTKNNSATLEERTVCQFHYSAWPDHGVPPLVRPLLDMVRLVRDTQASETLPVLVHCSAGCGRTGTICAIDYVWGLLRAGKLTTDFSLFKLVREMRKQRIAMVQTKEQYVLVHHAVKELFNEQLRMIDSHPYENIDVNGMVKESPEPVYATITCISCNEEKQDSNEKESVQDTDDAPPLPRKRKPYTAHTKQEKEVENHTEKQRSIGEQAPFCKTPSPSGSASILQKPRIAKLKALFERSSRDGKSIQTKHRSTPQVTRSHSLGAVRKVEDVTPTQPIPNKGILRVPQLVVMGDVTSRSSRPALPIKRSKSLKVLSSGERNKFSVPALSKGIHAKGSSKEDTCTPKTTIPLSHSAVNKPLREELVPTVPPKKIVNDKPNERKVINPPSGGMRNSHYENVNCSPMKSCEDVQTVGPRISTLNCWRRRSLDSLPVENNSVLVSDSAAGFSGMPKTGPSILDLEALKVWQDCNDYLLASAKSECSLTSGNLERRFQETNLHDVNLEQLQHLTVEAQRKVNAVVAGLGTRERRNSFRQAISKDVEPGTRHQEYETVWLNKGMPSSSVCVADVSQSAVSSELRVVGEVAPKVSPVTTQCVPINNNFQSTVRETHARKQNDLKVDQNKPVDSVKVKRYCVQTENVGSPGYVNQGEVHGYKQVKKFPYSEYSPLNRGGVLQKPEVDGKGKACSVPSHKEEIRTRIHTCMPPQNPRNMCPGLNKTHNYLESTHQSDYVQLVAASVKPGSNGSSEVDTKNTSISIARRVNTVPCNRPMQPNMNNMEQLDRLGIGKDSDVSVMYRPVHSNASTGQGLNELKDTMPISGLQINLPQEKVNSFTSPMVREIQVQDTVGNMKGQYLDNVRHMSRNQERVGKGQHKDFVDKSAASAVNVNLRRPERTGKIPDNVYSVSNPVTKLPWPSRPAPQTQEQKYQVRNSDNGPLRTTERIEQETVTSPAGIGRGQRGRNVCINRAPAKVTVKHWKDGSTTNEGFVDTKFHHGSQDDLALCTQGAGSSNSSRVRRHASVVLLRHSLIENNDATPLAPLTVWNASQPGAVDDAKKATGMQNTKQDIDAWSGAPGVDVDMVAASIKPNREHVTPLTRALEAFHLRKPRVGAVSPPQQRRLQPMSQVVVKKQHYL